MVSLLSFCIFTTSCTFIHFGSPKPPGKKQTNIICLLICTQIFFQEDNLSCIKRPFSKPVQFFTCLNFFGYLTPNNESFIKAVNFWLGHPLKLFFGK